jgi:hypothetical protein
MKRVFFVLLFCSAIFSCDYYSLGEGGIIKKFTTEVVKNKWEHMFSKNHLRLDIQLLGKDKSEIVNKFINIIKQADAKNLLTEGDNAIRTIINSQSIIVKVYIQAGEVINLNGYLGDSARKWFNTVTL